MFNDTNCKILKKDYIKSYKDAFTSYGIKIIYGESLVMGSDLLKDDEDDK